MAEFDVDFESLDGLIRSLSEMSMFDDDMQAKLLNAGSETLMDTIQEEAQRAPYDLKTITNKLSRSKKIKKDKNDARYVDVTVSGKNARGERNATVAFVLNYGRSERYGKIQGSYFWTRAVRRTDKAVLDTYEKIVTKELEERKLI